MHNTIAIYPGTFDPFTRGHEDLVLRACRLWPRVVVGVAFAYHKKTLFSLEERLQIVQNYFAGNSQVQVKGFDGLLKDFALQEQANVVIRGLRAAGDFEYEFQMAGMNRHLMPDVETVFLTPSSQFQFVSSSLIRETSMLGGDIRAFISEDVQQRLEHKRKK